jgi:hypothetical protein
MILTQSQYKLHTRMYRNNSLTNRLVAYHYRQTLCSYNIRILEIYYIIEWVLYRTVWLVNLISTPSISLTPLIDGEGSSKIASDHITNKYIWSSEVLDDSRLWSISLLINMFDSQLSKAIESKPPSSSNRITHKAVPFPAWYFPNELVF